MEPKERILKIIENSGLTPSEFADKIGVQRSAISHITSGRNNPSLDFLIKIKTEFPEIDTDWLIFGIEKEDEIEIENEIHSQDKMEKPIAPTLFELSDFDKKPVEKPETHQKEEELKPEIKSDKKLIRLLLLYNDGSFDDFRKD